MTQRIVEAFLNDAIDLLVDRRAKALRRHVDIENHCRISGPPEDDQVVDGLRRSKVEQSGRPESPRGLTLIAGILAIGAALIGGHYALQSAQTQAQATITAVTMQIADAKRKDREQEAGRRFAFSTTAVSALSSIVQDMQQRAQSKQCSPDSISATATFKEDKWPNLGLLRAADQQDIRDLVEKIAYYNNHFLQNCHTPEAEEALQKLMLQTSHIQSRIEAWMKTLATADTVK